MPRHVEAYLNGVSLRSAAPKIWIQQVEETMDALDMTTAITPLWDGERQAREARRSLRVTLTATIHEVFNLETRAAALDAIAAWTGDGGILTLSYRPGKRLRVIPTNRPTLGKARDYTQEISVELTAYAVPFWEDAVPTSQAGTPGSTGTVILPLTGSHETPLDAVITARAAVTELSLSAGGRTIALEGLSLAAGDTLTLEHTDDDVLVIRSGTTRLFEKVTAASDDDILLTRGPNEVTWEADAPIDITVTARGRYE